MKYLFRGFHLPHKNGITLYVSCFILLIIVKKNFSNFFFKKGCCNQVIVGVGLESQVLSSSSYRVVNKPYFVHHKEETMSSVFSSDYIRAAFSRGNGNRRKAR